MMGFDFAQHVNNYLIRQGLTVKSIGKIEKNPEKSKHLETATCTVLGLELDFVNLRAELYSHDSRIPTAVSF